MDGSRLESAAFAAGGLRAPVERALRDQIWLKLLGNVAFLQAGRRLELDCMTGAIIELAGRLGVDVPHVRTVHACATLLDSVNRGSAARVAQ